jgi:hypothetical protein
MRWTRKILLVIIEKFGGGPVGIVFGGGRE